MRLANLTRRVGADLLVNVDARDRTGGIFKSSVLIGPNGSRGAYSKTRLVPFGEYVPLRPLLGWATRHTKAAGEDRRRGNGLVVFTPDGCGKRPGNRRRARHRTADQLRDNLLRPSPPGGAARRAATGLSEFHLDVPGNLGATAVSQPGRGTRRGGGPSRGARRFVGCQRCLRRTRSATRLVPRHRTRCDRGRCPARITHHPVPTAWELGSGAVLFDPRGRRRRCDPTVTARGWDRRAHLAHRGPHRSAVVSLVHGVHRDLGEQFEFARFEVTDPMVCFVESIIECGEAGSRRRQGITSQSRGGRRELL